jgi:hypothetical protein
MNLPSATIGVTVSRGKDKGKKRKGAAAIEPEKSSNFDLLKKLGFDKDLI